MLGLSSIRPLNQLFRTGLQHKYHAGYVTDVTAIMFDVQRRPLSWSSSACVW